ncbi:MAG: thioesterase [Firmicutes bacterium HGW-Firmicutes-12]|jgi:predicted thioesterase|nr:MAG: thioesterase [Firmicutes bacterium HGW-Firmicutes-12]
MEISLKPGMTCEKTEIVTENNTAIKYGSGSVNVYATPAMVGLMENASFSCVDLHLPAGYLTVGTFVDVKHLTATPVGMKVTAKVELVLVEGKRLEFKVEAYDEKEKIGEGTHGRYIINQNKFMSKTEEKGK